MINIAVCDDDVQFAAALEEKILDYGKWKGVRLYTWMLKWEKAMGYIQFGR